MMSSIVQNMSVFCPSLQVCLHANIDFSSVFVIINLQTWVLLLDYLGIGIPTPPSSRPESPTTDQEEGPSFVFNDTREEGLSFKARTNESIATEGLFQEDAAAARPEMDPQEGTPVDSFLDSVYLSTCPEMTRNQDTSLSSSLEGDISGNRHNLGTVLPDLSAMQGVADNLTATASEEPKSSVWGVEGKLSMAVKLNVDALTVTFNKPEHPLARGSVTGVSATVKLFQGNMEISGSLGQGSVIDMTETGAYYRERYVMLYSDVCIFTGEN